MAFIEDFAIAAGIAPTGGIGQTLANRPGWTLVAGEDVLIIDSSGRLERATGTVPINAYLRPDDGSTDHRVMVDFLANGSLIGPLAMASGTSLATLNGYWMRPQTGGASARVLRINNGVVETTSLLTPTFASQLGLELRVSVVAGDAQIEVWQGGAKIAGPVTDNSANKKVSGRRGITTNSGSSIRPALDNFVDSSIVPTSIMILPRAVPFVAGVLGASSISYAVTWSASPTTLEARLVGTSGDALTGFDWSTKIANPSGGGGTVQYGGAPVGGPYRLQVRDSAAPGTVITGQEFWVGAVLPINDQSLHEIMATGGKPPATGAFASVTANRVFVLGPTSRNDPNTAPVFARLDTPGAYGSGYVAVADQIARDWPAHIPILLVDISYQGEPMPSWIKDNNPGGWPLRTGYAAKMFDWVGGRITALIRPVVVSPIDVPGGIPTFTAAYDQLIALFDAMLTNQPTPYQVWIPPQSRVSRAWSLETRNLRENGYAQAMRGGRYRLLHGPALGIRVRNNQDGHQADGTNGQTAADPIAHAQGNQLLGRYMGRGIVNRLQTLLGMASPPDNIGVRIVSVQFVDVGCTALRVTFSRAVRTKDGVTAALPQSWVSSDNWATKKEITGTLQADGVTLICAKPAGDTWAAGLRYDYGRDSPYSTDTTDSPAGNVVNGNEADVQPKLDLLLRDTSAFDGNRGMFVMPEIAGGMVVADAGASAVVITGSATVAGGNTLALSLTINSAA